MVGGYAVDRSNSDCAAGDEEELAHENRRKFPRLKTNLTGRYMLSDRREFECTITDIALGGIGLVGPQRGALGESVVVYIDQLCRVEGEIVRYKESGFALKLTLTSRKTDKLARHREDIRGDKRLDDCLDRRHQTPQIESKDPVVLVTLPLGDENECEVLDLSCFGADIKIEDRPAIGTPVQLGQLRGTVVRNIDQGVAIEFDETSDSVSLTYQFDEVASPA